MSQTIELYSLSRTESDINTNCIEMTANEVTQKHNRFSVDRVDVNNVSNDCEPTQRAVDQYMTREAPPRVDHYRNVLSIHGRVSRPTLEELHVGQIPENYMENQMNKDAENGGKEAQVKFGWIQGVLIRCMLNIWGVMLFLRLSWVIGQAGIGLGSLVVILATSVTVITTISMCAICTNGEVKGGGTYYMISRSLGPEFGGSIGIIFSLANAIAVAMYVIGFSEALQDLFEIHEIKIIDGSLNDIRIISCVTTCILLCIAIIGTEWETKAQIVLLFILLLSMSDFLIGTFLPQSVEEKAKGYVGFNLTLFRENFMPDFRNETFFSVFAVFFPSVTGMLAGANISGDLKDPSVSIPRGSLLAICITSVSYLLFAFICGATVLRDANGITSLVENNTSNYISLIRDCSLNDGNKCKYGLHNNFQVMELISAFGPLIYAGIFAATLSSALASLVSAPKVFQALCKDKLFPYIKFFGKGFGKNNEPRRGYLLAFAIAIGCCIVGELNLIAPIISNFFLGAYCLINFSCFHASLAKSPGFRPSFKYFNKWISLLGSILSFAIMFTGHWSACVVTFVLVLALYLYILNRKPNVNWGSSTQAKTYISALSSVYKLNFVPFHVKNYRPQILILCGNPTDRPSLVDFGYTMAKKSGLVICGHVQDIKLTQRSREKHIQEANGLMRKRRIKGFYNIVEENKFSNGVKSMIQSVGLGKLRPNIVLMGFKNNWLTCNEKEVFDYFKAIHQVFDNYLGLGILRLSNGLDYSRFGKINEIIDCMTESRKTSLGIINKSFVVTDFIKNDSDITFNSIQSNDGSDSSSLPSTPITTRTIQFIETPNDGEITQIPKNILSAVNQFRRQQKKGCIDVWWLYDDGGLTLLLPYLLTTRKQWSNCKLRVFALASNENELDNEKRNMASLLSKFRISYSDVTIIPDLIKPPDESSLELFDQIISKWIRRDSDTKTGLNNNNNDKFNEAFGVTETEVLALKEKTNRHIRLRELLCQHSKDATLIVMTLPMPRKGSCSAPMYLAWLEILTNNMPPFLLIRGNQMDVLTFYS